MSGALEITNIFNFTETPTYQYYEDPDQGDFLSGLKRTLLQLEISVKFFLLNLLGI